MRRTVKRAAILLDLERLATPGLVSFARVVVKGLDPTINTYVTAADLAKLPWPAATIAAAATALDDTHIARGTASSKTSTKQERDHANTLMDYLTDTGAFIEGFANSKAAGDITVAEAIITSVGFPLRKARGKTAPAGFKATSPKKGAARVSFPKTALRSVRLLSYSPDQGKTWSFPVVVHGKAVTITGLKSATEYLFKFAVNVPPAKRGELTVAAGNEEPTWSDEASCVIS